MVACRPNTRACGSGPPRTKATCSGGRGARRLPSKRPLLLEHANEQARPPASSTAPKLKAFGSPPFTTHWSAGLAVAAFSLRSPGLSVALGSKMGSGVEEGLRDRRSSQPFLGCELSWFSGRAAAHHRSAARVLRPPESAPFGRGGFWSLRFAGSERELGLLEADGPRDPTPPRSRAPLKGLPRREDCDRAVRDFVADGRRVVVAGREASVCHFRSPRAAGETPAEPLVSLGSAGKSRAPVKAQSRQWKARAAGGKPAPPVEAQRRL